MSYYLLVGLLDSFGAYISMLFLKQNFISDVFFYSQTWYPVLIFLCSRILIFIIFIHMKNKFNEEIIIEKYRKILAVMDIFLVIILRVYQTIMAEMIDGAQFSDTKKIIILLLMSLVMIALSVSLFFKNEIIKKENDFLNMRETLLFKNTRKSKIK